MTQVGTGQAAEHVALVAIYGGLGGREVAGSAGLHLNEAEAGTVPGDEIEIALHIAGRPAARNHGIAFSAQVEVGGILAGAAGYEMGGQGGAVATACQPIQAGQGALHPGQAHLLKDHGRPFCASSASGANGEAGGAAVGGLPCSIEWKEMIQYLYLGRVDYAEGLRLQAELAALRYEGRIENTLLLLEHPPVLTLGRNADRSNVLASDELLAARGVTLHQINRGGDVTYHGPGQLVGYPIFDLRSLQRPSGGRMGPVDFVRQMEEALIRLCGVYGVRAGRIAGLTGVWCGVEGESNSTGRKIGAIGIHVSRGITSHGFAYNVTTDLRDFLLINPCGITDKPVTSLELEVGEGVQLPELESIAHQAARQFGIVFQQQILAVESMEALRQGAAKRFPAEDTPLQVPAEVERLRGAADKPVRA